MTNKQDSDSKVQEVLALWKARFIANGIDALDLDRALATVDTWDDWAGAWTGMAADYETLGRTALEAGHSVTAGDYLRRAALGYHFARIFADPGGELHRRQTDLYRQAAPLLRPPAEEVWIDTPSATVPGYVRRPEGVDTPGVVLIVPGSDSVKEQLGAWEPYFLDRGIATVSIEGPGQGELMSMGFREETYKAAITGVSRYIAGLPGVDADRVVVVGVSLGGYIALKITPEVAAEVGLRGVVDFGGPYSLELDRYHGVIRESFIRLTGTTGEEEARAALAGSTLEGALAGIGVPAFIVHGGQDGICPVEDARRIAAEIGDNATLHIEPLGNHNINNFHTTSRPLVADWAADRIAES